MMSDFIAQAERELGRLDARTRVASLIGLSVAQSLVEIAVTARDAADSYRVAVGRPSRERPRA